MIETSSKDCDETVGRREDLNDCFSMSAINCYDISVAKHKARMMAQNQISPQKGSGTKSNRTFFYGGTAGIVGNRAKVQSEYFFDFEEPFNYKIPESEFDGQIMRKSYTSEGITPL